MTEPVNTGRRPTTGGESRRDDVLVRLRRYPMAIFLGALVLAFVSAPFDELFSNGDLTETIWLIVVLLAALFPVSYRRDLLALGVVLACLTLTGKFVNHYDPDLAPPLVYLLPGIAYLLLLLAQILRFIARAARVDAEVLCAAVASYLLIGLLWAMAYILTAQSTPDAFAFSAGPEAAKTMKGFTAVYYSMITLCTVGYGDIVPVSPVARMLAMTESIAGTLFMAILISRLVSLYSVAGTSTKTDDRA